MKRRIFFFLFYFLFSISVQAAENGWELKKDDEGIKVFTRPVQGSSVLEFKAEMTVPAPVEKVAGFYNAPDRFPGWFYQCIEARRLKQISDVEDIIYFGLSMPWPVSDRDCIYRRVQSKEGNGDIVFRLSALPDFEPKHPKRVRVPYLKTEWIFRKISEKETWVSYQQHSEAGGYLPGTLINKLTVTIPYNTLKNFREQVLEEPGA